MTKNHLEFILSEKDRYNKLLVNLLHTTHNLTSSVDEMIFQLLKEILNYAEVQQGSIIFPQIRTIYEINGNNDSVKINNAFDYHQLTVEIPVVVDDETVMMIGLLSETLRERIVNLTDISSVICKLIQHRQYHETTSIKHESYKFDFLTDTLNRREFELVMKVSLVETTGTFMFLDLDHFKIVNDTAGHQAGDELLKQITQLFVNNIRKTDIIGRLGGDEFGIILKGCNQAKAEEIAQTIIDKVKEFTFHYEDHSFSVGVSIGICNLHGSIQNVLALSDRACYISKHNGRNQFTFLEESSERPRTD